MKKLLIRTICILLIVATISPFVFAEDNVGIQPRYTYIQYVAAEIQINNSVANCSATFRTYDQYDLKITCQLQQKLDGKWKTIATWYAENSNSNYVISQRNLSIINGEQYRFAVYGYVYRGDSLLENAYTCAV